MRGALGEFCVFLCDAFLWLLGIGLWHLFLLGLMGVVRREYGAWCA